MPFKAHSIPEEQAPLLYSLHRWVSGKLVFCSQTLSCRIGLWMLVCLNPRCMSLNYYAISTLNYVSFSTSSKTCNWMEVIFLGAELYPSYSFCPSRQGISAFAWMTPKETICPWQAEVGPKRCCLERELWTVILRDQGSPPRKPFLNKPRKSMLYKMVLTKPSPSNWSLAWIWSWQDSVTEMVLDLFPLPSDLWVITSQCLTPLALFLTIKFDVSSLVEKISWNSFPCCQIFLFLAASGRIWIPLCPQQLWSHLSSMMGLPVALCDGGL